MKNPVTKKEFTPTQKTIAWIAIKAFTAASLTTGGMVGGYIYRGQVVKWKYRDVIKEKIVRVKVREGNTKFDVSDWWFEKEVGGFRAKSYGPGEYDVAFARPDRWKERPFRRHVLGLGGAVGLSGLQPVYGIQIAYTYRITENLGIRPAFTELLSQTLRPEELIFLTVEYALK